MSVLTSTREPLALRAGVTAVVTLGAGLLAVAGIGVSDETRENLITVALLLAPVVPLVLAWWARRHVTPVAAPRDEAGNVLAPVTDLLDPLL